MRTANRPAVFSPSPSGCCIHPTDAGRRHQMTIHSPLSSSRTGLPQMQCTASAAGPSSTQHRHRSWQTEQRRNEPLQLAQTPHQLSTALTWHPLNSSINALLIAGTQQPPQDSLWNGCSSLYTGSQQLTNPSTQVIDINMISYNKLYSANMTCNFRHSYFQHSYKSAIHKIARFYYFPECFWNPAI